MDKISLSWVIARTLLSEEAKAMRAQRVHVDDYWNQNHVSWEVAHVKNETESFQSFFHNFEIMRKKDSSIQLKCCIKINDIAIEDFPEIRENCNPPFKGFRSIFELANSSTNQGILNLDDISILNVVLNKILNDTNIIYERSEKFYWQEDLNNNYLPLFTCLCLDLYCGSYGTTIIHKDKSIIWEWEVDKIKRRFEFEKNQYQNEFLEYRKFINECSKHPKVIAEIDELEFSYKCPSKRLRFYSKNGNYFINKDEIDELFL